MPLMVHKEGPNATNILWGLGVIFILVVITVISFAIGGAYDIQDFYILGGMFSVFTLITFICLFGTMLRPTYRMRRQVSTTDRPISELERDRTENVGFRFSASDLKNGDRIAVSPHGSLAGERTDNVLIDVKSRVGSANSLLPPRSVRFQ